MLPRCHLIILLFVGIVLPACVSSPRGPDIVAGGVRFVLRAPQAKSVSIAGTFNQWDMRKNRLAGPDTEGAWSTIVNLPPGRYEYLFILDEKVWLPDPGASVVDDGMGGKNSQVIVE